MRPEFGGQPATSTYPTAALIRRGISATMAKKRALPAAPEVWPLLELARSFRSCYNS
jgi:hypothetical protein